VGDKIKRNTVFVDEKMGKLTIHLNEGKRGFNTGYALRPVGGKTVNGGGATHETIEAAEAAVAKHVQEAYDGGWTLRTAKAGKLTAIPVATPAPVADKRNVKATSKVA
jgi:hypothetical protein